MNRSHNAVTLLQASQNNPGLAALMAQQEASSKRFRAIDALLPGTLKAHIQAGPMEDGVWCLLLANNTTAAKLRQLLPALEAHLRSHDLAVKSIRLKVHRPNAG